LEDVEVMARNKLGARMTSLRGVGATVNQFAAEGFMEEIATARGEMRLDLL
jgi:hypothetical protein